MSEETETPKPTDVAGRLDGLVICPSCKATMPFSFTCQTCSGAGGIEKSVAMALSRASPFQKSKLVIDGNPTGDGWACNKDS